MTPRTEAMRLPETVQSVVQTQRNGPLIAAAAQLWIRDDDKVLDLTYGRGLFWTDFRPADLITNDWDPATDADHHYDFTEPLPFRSQSFDVVVFDPPYIAQGGRETSQLPDFMDRYGLREVPKTTELLANYINRGIIAATAVLADKGRLLVKCMDYINGGEYVAARHDIVEQARFLGLTQVEEFVHYSGVGPQPRGRRQVHSRRAHSFLCVFQKGRWVRRGEGGV